MKFYFQIILLYLFLFLIGNQQYECHNRVNNKQDQIYNKQDQIYIQNLLTISQFPNTQQQKVTIILCIKKYNKKMFGIQAMQIYFPKTYICQQQYQKHLKIPSGKHRIGLGQLQLSFCYPFQDINSMCLTAVRNLLKSSHTSPSQIGRLQVGTQTLIDKSKSTKTILMDLFKGCHDIQGVTCLNACYGGTSALINTLNWITSKYWDGRKAIVVMGDQAVYQDGPARPTGGAGVVAMLIGPKGKITFDHLRASFMDNQWDFYKPMPSSQYPVVDGKLSIQCYLNSIQECYKKLKQKHNNKDFLKQVDYYCFHAPFHKMVQKSFTKLKKLASPSSSADQILSQFTSKVQPSCYLPRILGNTYTSSLYAGLLSLLLTTPQIQNKSALLFSYGSGLCSTMMTIKIHQNILSSQQIEQIHLRIKGRVKIGMGQYMRVMKERELNYGKFHGKIQLVEKYIHDNTYYLREIDAKYRRHYQIKNPTTLQININKNQISALERLNHINHHLLGNDQSKFYKLNMTDRIQIVNKKINKIVDHGLLQSGGLNMQLADSMIQNVIGTLSLPLAVVPLMVINKKKYMIPMCIQQPSVVAAVSSISKLLSQVSFFTSSTPSIMIGQVHLPDCPTQQMHKILSLKQVLILYLNGCIQSMVSRGGGITDIRVRELQSSKSTKQYVLQILINVCQVMGANITNMICQKAKEYVERLGISTGIAVLSNYSTERRAIAWFQIPIQHLKWKGVMGQELVDKVLQAYQFAKIDKHRATTHNKGIMNGIDAVCLATGQDWRAVQSSAHTYASKNGQYQPLTHYQIITKNDTRYFRGSIQLPIAVGSKGGVIQKNSIYRMTLDILGNPSSQQLSQIIVAVGLAQNFAALRALAIEGIQKGHMILHSRTIAQKAGVPKHLIQDACKFMAFRKKYDVETAKLFLDMENKSKL